MRPAAAGCDERQSKGCDGPTVFRGEAGAPHRKDSVEGEAASFNQDGDCIGVRGGVLRRQRWCAVRWNAWGNGQRCWMRVRIGWDLHVLLVIALHVTLLCSPWLLPRSSALSEQS